MKNQSNAPMSKAQTLITAIDFSVTFDSLASGILLYLDFHSFLVVMGQLRAVC
jgi:hypothetical protein